MVDAAKIISLLKTKEIISAPQVLDWMKSKDIKVLGALYVLTDEAWHRIKPELGMEATCEFILEYYKRCIIENPDSGDVLLNRYEAGWSFASWFKHLWSKKPETDKILQKAKNILGELFIEGKQEIRECIVNAVLEHVFEHKEIPSFFEDWRNKPPLDDAYNMALEWGKEHWNKNE